ncbi:NADP-dependent isocitrate dehydrogenase, partial [Streptomyces sp. NPDC007206]|uniref:NADP-dependent isocitrate dehydrogenase n=1 Tax=Streptomyces sp. NPDC007206 TaxID=3154317 RepID=UPI0033F01DAA
KTPAANMIKLPNISASIPQLKAAIAELQGKGQRRWRATRIFRTSTSRRLATPSSSPPRRSPRRAARR